MDIYGRIKQAKLIEEILTPILEERGFKMEHIVDMRPRKDAKDDVFMILLFKGGEATIIEIVEEGGVYDVNKG